MAQTVIPVWMQQEVLERDGWKCLSCGIPVHRHPDGKSRPNSAHMDHIVPDNATHRGLTEVDNLQTLCRTCNLAKGNRVIDYRPTSQEARTERARQLFAAMHARVQVRKDGSYVIADDTRWMYTELTQMGYTPSLIKQGLDAHSAVQRPPLHMTWWERLREERQATRASQSTTTVPAGWYSNPLGAGRRYWDGARWTDHTAP